MLLWRNAKCSQEKSYHYQICHCLKVKPSSHKELFQKEKNKLLRWIYAQVICGSMVGKNRQSPASTETPASSERSKMYIRKSVGPRIEPWGTPTLTGYSCEGLPFRTTQLSITEKIRNKAKYLTLNSIRLSLWRRPTCQTLSKALDLSIATARVALDQLKALVILSDTTVRRSAVDREDLKPYWK